MQRQESRHRDTSVSNSGYRVGGISRYDLVLAFVPLSFLTAALAGLLLPVPTRTFVVGAGLASALAVVDALFVNPPRPGSLS